MTRDPALPSSNDPKDAQNDPRDVMFLPPLGEATKSENWNGCNNYLNRMGLKLVSYYENPGPSGQPGPIYQADINAMVYVSGKQGPVSEKDVISRKITRDLNTLVASLTHQPVTRKIGAAEHQDPPENVPYIDPSTGQQDVFPVDDQLESEFEQFILDWHWDRADLDIKMLPFVHNARVCGWYTMLVDWDWATMLPQFFTSISVKQVLIDVSVDWVHALERANLMCMRWRLNWWQSRVMFPELNTYTSALVTDGVERVDPILPLGRNQQAQQTGERMVDVSFWWFRNYPVAPMSVEEALAYGELEQRPVGIVAPEVSTNAANAVGQPPALPAELPSSQHQPGVGGDVDGPGGDSVLGGGMGGPTDLQMGGEDGDDEEAENQDMGVALLSGALSGPSANGSALFLAGTNQQVKPGDPGWPWWLGLRRLSRVENFIADDRIENRWDFPFAHLCANPVPLSALGMGDPEMMQSLQEGRNRAWTNLVEHTDLMAHPIRVYSKSMWDKLPAEYKIHGASVAGMYVIIPDADYKLLGGKIKVTDDPPTLSPAIAEALDKLGVELENATMSPQITQGKQPGDVTGWQSMQIMQQQASNQADMPAQLLAAAVTRIVKLVRWMILWNVPIPRLQEICSHLPPEVVEYLVLRGRKTDRNVECECSPAGGGVMARRIADAKWKFEAGLISRQTFTERVGENWKQEQQRMQQENAGKQDKPPSTSINFKDLPPNGQIQLASQAMIQLTPQDMLAQQMAEQQAAQAKAKQPAHANGNGRM